MVLSLQQTGPIRKKKNAQDVDLQQRFFFFTTLTFDLEHWFQRQDNPTHNHCDPFEVWPQFLFDQRERNYMYIQGQWNLRDWLGQDMHM